MKVKIHLSNGSSPTIELGEVPDVIRNDKREMFKVMWDSFRVHGINVHEVLIEDISITGVD